MHGRKKKQKNTGFHLLSLLAHFHVHPFFNGRFGLKSPVNRTSAGLPAGGGLFFFFFLVLLVYLMRTSGTFYSIFQLCFVGM